MKYRSPAASGLNDREFNEFLGECESMGFEVKFDFPYPCRDYEKDLSAFIDKVYDDIKDLINVEKCLGNAQDFLGGFSEKPAYYCGKKLTAKNKKKFMSNLYTLQEELRFRLIDWFDASQFGA